MKAFVHYLVVFMIAFLKHSICGAPQFVDIWVAWNVGQGQWVTHILTDECRHYDIGGEFGSFAPLKRLLIQNCGLKMNVLHLSHWDYDHFLNVLSLARTFPHICWRSAPQQTPLKATVQKVTHLRLPACNRQYSGSTWIWRPKTWKTSNEASAVFWEQYVLIPGDSPLKYETEWKKAFQAVIHLSRVLILGHHGSKTSTGLPLLNALPDLGYAIASARYRRYRHPHPVTAARLRQFNIPLLRTEDWGNIWFQP